MYVRVKDDIDLYYFGFVDSNDDTCLVWEETKWSGVVVSKKTRRITGFNSTGSNVLTDKVMTVIYNLINLGLTELKEKD